MPPSDLSVGASRAQWALHIIPAALLGLVMPFLVAACHTAAAATPGSAAAHAALHDVLPELAKGHSDKVQLAFYATSFLRHVDPPVKDFAERMGQEHKKLLDELKAVAKKGNYDLRFHFADDVMGKAREAMEKEQGAMIQADANPDFQRDILVLMYSDYDWQLNLIRSVLPVVNDPQLAAYLQESERVHAAGVKEIQNLLKRYKFQG